MTIEAGIFDGRVNPFSEAFREALREVADICAKYDAIYKQVMDKISEPRDYRIGGTPAAASDALALSITGGSGDPTDGPISYMVDEGSLDADGEFVPNGNSGVMWNRYEFDPYGHGQELSFTQGTLAPSPLSGVVFGGLVAVIDEVRVYICDVPDPMNPSCATPGFAAASVAPNGSSQLALSAMRGGF